MSDINLYDDGLKSPEKITKEPARASVQKMSCSYNSHVYKYRNGSPDASTVCASTENQVSARLMAFQGSFVKKTWSWQFNMIKQV